MTVVCTKFILSGVHVHEREAYLSSARAQKIERQREDAKSGHVVVEEQGEGSRRERGGRKNFLMSSPPYEHE